MCDHTAVMSDDTHWYLMRFVATEYVDGVDLEVRECPRCHQELSRPLMPDVTLPIRYGIGTPRGPRPVVGRATTTKLPVDWKPTVPHPSTGPTRPEPSKATRAAARMQTDVLPVIGRAGTRERVRAGDAMFGGGEAR